MSNRKKQFFCAHCGHPVREEYVTPEKPMEKICSSCRRRLPLTAYHARAKSPDGRQHICKDCTRLRRERRLMERTKAKEEVMDELLSVMPEAVKEIMSKAPDKG